MLTFVSEGTTNGTASVAGETAPTAPTAHWNRTGDYTFLGYYTEGGEQVYNEHGEFVQGSLSGLSSDTTLYARWAPPEGSIAKLVYRGQLTKLGLDDAASSGGRYTKTMHFRVYDDESAETPIWRADNQTVNVNKDGSFVATFGDEELAGLIATGSVTHVGVAIGASAIELKPRRALRPVAAVNRALVAEAAGKDPRIGNLVTENALAANSVTVSQLEVAGTVTAPGAGAVDVSPVVVGDRETLTLLRGEGVNVFSKNRIDLGETANVQRGQKIGSKAAPSDGIALIASRKTGSRGLRIPGVIQYCREGDWVRAPASEPDGVKVTFFPFIGKESK
ncbi:MAG: InlB B-repeat-containing protein [Kiritimatiellae bacterium]|nr:InlB B-repeat-containing protein [Kiritimatiellia bacterium]